MSSMSDEIDEAKLRVRRDRSVLTHTLATLIKSSKKAREKLNAVKKLEIQEIKPVVQTRQLLVKAQAQGLTESDRLHQVRIMFSQVDFSPIRDKDHPLEADLGNGNKMYLEHPRLEKHKVQCRCSCSDYYFMWQWYNRQEKALFGKKFPDYVRKTDHLPERNPGHHPGLCKHLMKLVERLAEMGLIKR